MAKFRGAVITCKTCGSGFKVPPSRASKANYCSFACAGVGRGIAAQKRVPLLCEECGEIYIERECHADRRRFCSNRCRNANREYRKEIAARGTADGNAHWKGGRPMHSDGYVLAYAPNHPFASNGYVMEHRVVKERWLRENDPTSPFLVEIDGVKYLDPRFVVHHDDEDRTNNSPENLFCMTNAEHVALHAARRRQKERQSCR